MVRQVKGNLAVAYKGIRLVFFGGERAACQGTRKAPFDSAAINHAGGGENDVRRLWVL